MNAADYSQLKADILSLEKLSAADKKQSTYEKMENIVYSLLFLSLKNKDFVLAKETARLNEVLDELLRVYDVIKDLNNLESYSYLHEAVDRALQEEQGATI